MILYGYQSVLERLKNKKNTNILYITEKKLTEEIKNKTIISTYTNYKIVTNDYLTLKCKSPYHNSIGLEVDNLYINENLKNLKNHVLILDSITDVGNLGAIIRSCGILSYDLILCRNNTAPINSITSKNAAGGLEYINIHQCGSLIHTIQQLKKLNYFIIGATEKQENIPYVNLKFLPDKLVLIIGGEHIGISKGILKELDFIIKIPGNPNFCVYNASVAAALGMFILKNSL